MGGSQTALEITGLTPAQLGAAFRRLKGNEKIIVRTLASGEGIGKIFAAHSERFVDASDVPRTMFVAARRLGVPPGGNFQQVAQHLAQVGGYAQECAYEESLTSEIEKILAGVSPPPKAPPPPPPPKPSEPTEFEVAQNAMRTSCASAIRELSQGAGEIAHGGGVFLAYGPGIAGSTFSASGV
jgi:hypothetical protein